MEQGRVGKRGLQVMVWAVVLAAVGVSMASLQQAPIYEAVARVMVEESGEYRGVPPTELVMHAIESRPVAEATIQRLGLETAPAELLENLSVERIEYTRFIVLSYEDTDPHRATQIVNTVGQVSSELSERSAAGSPKEARPATNLLSACTSQR